MKNLAKNFVLSRVRISNSSIQVGNLYITPNFEENVSDEILSEVSSIIKKNFQNVRQLNGKSIRNLQHMFNDDVKTTQFFMGTLTLLTIDNCKFVIINNKVGISNPIISVVEVQKPVEENHVVEEVKPAETVEENHVVEEVKPAETVEEVKPAETVEEVKPAETVKVSKPKKIASKDVVDAQKENINVIEESLK